MLMTVTETLRSALPFDSEHAETPTGRNNHRDALAALSLLVGNRTIGAASERSAIFLLVGLPHWLTTMIVARYSRTKHDCPIETSIMNILFELENEGVLGPAA